MTLDPRQQTTSLDPTAVDTWIFDLDNTLYPPSCDLFTQISRRMGEYIAQYLDLSLEEARRVQKKYFRAHGTTLRGMMTMHEMDPGPFLDYVHEIDFSPIQADPELANSLRRLDGRRLIFTNGTRAHARRVTDRLGITDLFDGVFDIDDSGYLPKPHPEPYAKMVATFDVDPSRAILFEDMARNLVPAAEMGMTTAWVSSQTDWAAEGRDHAAVHYHVDDLARWLGRLVT